MFEHKKEPLLSPKDFRRRQRNFGLIALLLVLGSLFLGVAGYHLTESMSWLDALLNASMILAGMGPVNNLVTDGGKLFASFYALFSGVVFLIAIGVLVAPSLHRLMHKFHLQTDE